MEMLFRKKKLTPQCTCKDNCGEIYGFITYGIVARHKAFIACYRDLELDLS